MVKWLPWIIVTILLVWICTLYIRKFDNTNCKSDTIVVTKLKYINDSIITIIDSSNIKIKNVNNWYEKEFSDIINQSTISDVEFFTNYLATEAGK